MDAVAIIVNGKIPNKIAPIERDLGAGVQSDRRANGAAPEQKRRRNKKEKTSLGKLSAATRVKLGFTRWKDTVITKENNVEGHKRRSNSKYLSSKSNFLRMNAGQLSDLEDLVDISKQNGAEHIPNGKPGTNINSSSRALIYYFAKLSANANENGYIDLEFVDTLIKCGASLNTTDRHGQTIMHEAVRQWEVGVARFLMERGTSINQSDRYGRTPLHVAAAVDYPDMVEFLVESGADIHARTHGELQTPIHFAARNDAVGSLKMLLKCGANMEDRDFKQRTPLQVAAELDRSETAKVLIQQGADAGVTDESGMTALVLMICKMPVVAKDALGQFYSRDRANRKQYFHLNYLEPTIPKIINNGWPQTALEVVVQHKQFELLMHPVFQRLLRVKWQRFGRKKAWLHVILSLLFVLLWTLVGVTKADNINGYYTPVSQKWWRITLSILAVLMTLNEIRREIAEFLFSKKEHRLWLKWREAELQRDLEHCHPRWPGERLYLTQEIDYLHEQEPTYFTDPWNVFDWLAFFMIFTTVVTHLVSISIDNIALHKAHVNLMSATLILLWIRLLKTFRAFTALGPFVVMLNHLVYDLLKFTFLYIVFYIPYAVSFWMVFASHNINGYSTIPDLLYSMFRMTVVDDYNYDELAKAEPYMSKILCGTYLAFSAIICLNLFIALMSDTFQRVYDNVKANAAMQRASTILSIENGLSVARKKQFVDYIHTRCSPVEMYYDDDVVDDQEGDLMRMTHQIKQELEDVHGKINAQAQKQQTAGDSGIGGIVSRDELDKVREDLGRVEQQQQALTAQFHTQIGEVKQLLSEVLACLNQPVASRSRRTRTNSSNQ